MEYAGFELTGNTVNAGDHQQQTLRSCVCGCQCTSFQCAVHGTCGTGFGFHFYQTNGLTENILLAVCGPAVNVFRHGINLRCDDTFVQDEGWYAAQQRYEDFVHRHEKLRIVYLELGVGSNTPVWIKYPFWQRTLENPKAVYACINMGEAVAPREIARQSICIDGDIGDALRQILQ